MFIFSNWGIQRTGFVCCDPIPFTFIYLFIYYFHYPRVQAQLMAQLMNECLYFIDICSVLSLSFAVLSFMLSCVTACSTFLHFYSFRSLDVCHCMFQDFRVAEKDSRFHSSPAYAFPQFFSWSAVFSTFQEKMFHSFYSMSTSTCWAVSLPKAVEVLVQSAVSGSQLRKLGTWCSIYHVIVYFGPLLGLNAS